MNAFLDDVRRWVQPQRLLDLARSLIAIPSPTGQAGKVLDRLTDYLKSEGFAVDRPAAEHPSAPAVVARLVADRPGRTLQWDGHLDTVHLPFIPDRVEGDRLRGSGASDMKAGLAAAVEAFLALRDGRLLSGGSVLLTAHDLHEAPWGDGRQFDRLILDGIVGDAVMIPEPLCDHLPVVGRGQACWKVTFRREGPPVHEVMRPRDQPDVVAAGARLISDLASLERGLVVQTGPMGLSPSVFVGMIRSGEMYNQFPQECVLEGTRRWLPGTNCSEVEAEFRAIIEKIVRDTGVVAELEFLQVRDAFFLDTGRAIVSDFQASFHEASGTTLECGVKPFVDDGNSVWGLAHVPAITHGPRAGGQHTTEEWVEIDDLSRVAQVYALTAMRFCPGGADVKCS